MSSVKVYYKKGKLRQEIEIGRHHLIGDEPVDVGGEDEGPAPFDYLASGLGLCTALTLKMYATRKGWPLENAEITVNVDHDKELTKFEREIHLIGNLDDAQKKRLIDIANHCPVHKALLGKIEIETKEV